MPINKYYDGTAFQPVNITQLTLPTASGKVSGFVAKIAVDSVTTVAVGDVLYRSSTGLKKSQANAVSTVPAVAIALEAGTGGTRLVLLQGYIKNTAWAKTVGARAYVDPTTAGALTTTQPSTTGQQIQDIGYFEAADTLYFDPNAVVLEK